MDREIYRQERQREQEDLQHKLWAETGTPGQTSQWLARLEELDPEHFEDFENEYRHHLVVTKRARELGVHLEKPPSRTDLVRLVNSITHLRATSDAGVEMDIVDYEARYHLLETANPDADWEEFMEKMKQGMTAEEIVEAALAFKRQVFAMPGPVDESWAREHGPASMEGT